MICHAFKGGIGTASRIIDQAGGGYRVGVLVQANHARRERVQINGAPIGREIPESEVPDIFLAFATGNGGLPSGEYSEGVAVKVPIEMHANAYLTHLFDAVVEATEEAIVNALFAATTMTGRDGIIVYELDVDRTLEILRSYWAPQTRRSPGRAIGMRSLGASASLTVVGE